MVHHSIVKVLILFRSFFPLAQIDAFMLCGLVLVFVEDGLDLLEDLLQLEPGFSQLFLDFVSALFGSHHFDSVHESLQITRLIIDVLEDIKPRIRLTHTV